MWDPYAEFEKTTLTNGLDVYATHWPNRPWEFFRFVIHSGAEQDPVGLEGLSHFLEHVASNNVSFVNQTEIEDFFKDYGGGVNLGVTNFHRVTYGFSIPTKKSLLTKAFSIFGHMLLKNKMEKFIERERQVIMAEFRREYAMSANFDLRMLEHRIVFGGYWPERMICSLGSLKSIEAISSDDLQKFYDRHYVPSNMSIVCVGGMKLSEVLKILSRSPFAANKEGINKSLPVSINEISQLSENNHFKHWSDYFKDTDSIETGSYRSVARIPGPFSQQSMEVLSKMLSEVLNNKVREELAWTYEIVSDWHNFRCFFGFYIVCRSFSPQAVDTIQDVVNECILSLEKNEKLFCKVKKRMIAGSLFADLSAEDLCGKASSEVACFHRIITNSEDDEMIRKVTMDDIRKLLHYLRPENRWTLIIKP